MFRPSLGHPQALKENRYKITYVLQKRTVESQTLTECNRGTV